MSGQFTNYFSLFALSQSLPLPLPPLSSYHLSSQLSCTPHHTTGHQTLHFLNILSRFPPLFLYLVNYPLPQSHNPFPIMLFPPRKIFMKIKSRSFNKSHSASSVVVVVVGDEITRLMIEPAGIKQLKDKWMKVEEAVG